MINIGIGMPHLSRLEPEFFDSIVRLILELFKKGYGVRRITKNRDNVTFARNVIASKAMGCDYLLFIDDDMEIPHDLFFKLQRHKKDIVGALTFLRKPPYEPSMFRKHNDGRTFVPIFMWKPGEFIECDAVGMAATLIDCRVLRKMAKKEECYKNIYGFFDNKYFLGEDMRFCDKAKELGFKVFCDTSIIVNHIAYQGISFGDYAVNAQRKLMQEKHEKAINQNTTKKT